MMPSKFPSFALLAVVMLAVHGAVAQTDADKSVSTARPTVEAQPDAIPTVSHMGDSGANASTKENAFLVLSVLGFVIVFAIGAALGSKGTLVIYAGWFDFWISAMLPAIIFVHEPWRRYVAGLVLLLSLSLSYQANRSIPKALLAFPAKLGLPILTLFSGVLALGSASRLLKGETKDTRDTVMTAATGAACAAGFWFLTKFIRRLVEGEPSIADETPENPPQKIC